MTDDKTTNFYLKTDPKPIIDEKEGKVIGLTEGEYMIWKMLERIAEILARK